jgi:flagellar FliJ protein
MRFQYPFQKIVDLKNNEKTQAEWLLSQALGQLHKEESSLDQLQKEKDRLYELLSTAAGNRTSISELQLLQEYAEHLNQRIVEKNGEVLQAQTNVSSKRETLTHKMLDEKVWTTAKDKAYLHYVAAATKKDQAEADELTTMRQRTIVG